MKLLPRDPFRTKVPKILPSFERKFSSQPPTLPTTPFSFQVVHQSKKQGSFARVGRILTPHGHIDTPSFVGVATNGSMKALTMEMTQSTGLQILFNNTYHLMVHPGASTVASFGGLHKFSNWNGPIITDSGGFQVFSLLYTSPQDELKGKSVKNVKPTVLKVSEEGVLFRSYRNGEKIFLSPETSIQAQKSLGADIIIPLDELLPHNVPETRLLDSFRRTHEWEIRSLREHQKNPNQQAIYCVIHGGTNPELRQKSVHLLSQHPFDGYAIGGSLGKTRDQVITMLTQLCDYLPREKPSHLLGIGDLETIQRSLCLGFDTFDSSYPTKAGRHGTLFTKKGPLRIKKTSLRDVKGPIEEDCDCLCCKHHSLGYLHHLYKMNEPTALILGSLHNLRFMVRYFEHIRLQILQDRI